MLKQAREWVADRFGLKPIRAQVLERRVPKTPWYFGDGATLTLLFAVQIVTGMALSLTYSPTPDTAYESIQFITEQQTLGWFLRALHFWAAGIMVVMLFFHLFRQILLGGYKFPREGTWLFGVGLFFLVLVISFLGYLLRWDERALAAIQVMLTMFQHVPVIGEALVLLVQGGSEPGALTLTRIYSMHVIVLPALITMLIGGHLYLVIFHGVTSRRERKEPVPDVEEQRRLYKEQAHSEKEGEDFHPETTAKSGVMAMVVLAIVVALALIAGPAALLPEASRTDVSFHVEEWWFAWYSALIALLPPAIAPWFVVFFPLVVFVILVALPFVDRGPFRGIRKRPLALFAVAALVISLVALSALRQRSPWTGWPLEEPPPVPAGVELAPTAEQGRLLAGKYGCTSCHAFAGYGRQVAVDLARTPTPLSREHMRGYILQPPEGIAMPPYRGRLSDEELDQLLDFLLAVQMFPRTN
ncbi:hypothetical protein BH20VER2_BH20VER2_15570 [soil metagenome]